MQRHLGLDHNLRQTLDSQQNKQLLQNTFTYIQPALSACIFTSYLSTLQLTTIKAVLHCGRVYILHRTHRYVCDTETLH